MLLDRHPLDELVPPLERALVDELLEPTAIYAPFILGLARDRLLHAAAHVTGGGIVENLPRCLPEGFRGDVAWGSWPVPAIFELVRVAVGIRGGPALDVQPRDRDGARRSGRA